jgi:hypothetical protein
MAMVTVPVVASAQTRVGVYRGTGEYDLSGVDDGPVTAVRISRSVAPFFTLEGGLAHVKLRPDFGGDMHIYQPEVQGQLSLPLGVFSPYLGVGLGMAIATADEAESDSDFTMNGGVGVRVDLPFGLGIGVDGRIRSFGSSFNGTGADAVVGISYRF